MLFYISNFYLILQLLILNYHLIIEVEILLNYKNFVF